MRRPQYGHGTYVMCGTKLREFEMKTKNWGKIFVEKEEEEKPSNVFYYNGTKTVDGRCSTLNNTIWQPRNFRLVVLYAARAYTHQFYAYTQNRPKN